VGTKHYRGTASGPISASPESIGALVDVAIQRVLREIVGDEPLLLALASGREPSPEAPKTAGSAREVSSATGFGVHPSGLILTNHHVVEKAERIRVVDRQGKEYPARVMRRDAANDVALLRIEGTLHALPILRSGELRKGEQVLTVGYPLVDLQGADPKATFGRINSVEGAGGDSRFYQIDVPIQPGNSGGPLVDLRGRVVGLVTATLAQRTVLRTAGTLHQNVNYALKSAVIVPILLLEMPIEELPVVTESGELPVPELVDRIEQSLVRILAE
jgi:S1-C subfamily serine protease